MKSIFPLILLFNLLTTVTAQAITIIDKGIYGPDNRTLVIDHEEASLMKKKLAKSVFAQIPKWRITEENDEMISIASKSLASGLNFCPEEKFSELPIVSSCTAFLVGPDLLLTAGHCLKDNACQNNYWVLDYDDASGFIGPKGNVTFNKEHVYSCSRILSAQDNPKLDYGLIKLSRVVQGRTPFDIRRSGKVRSSNSLTVIGHPLGLPKIIADNANVLKNSLSNTFTADTDTFSGNSGSPIINSKTFMVEGILIRGDEDFKMDLDLGCNRSFICLKDDCTGETVQRTAVLPLDLIPKI